MQSSYDLKNILPNILSLACIAFGYSFSGQAAEALKTMGFFAFSGAITNWLAVHMLFEKVPLLYGSGVVPNNFTKFKSGIKDIIMHQFFSVKNLEKFISLSKVDIDAEDLFEQLVAELMESSLGGMLNMLGGAKMLQPLKGKVVAKIEEIIAAKLKDGSLSPELMHDKILFVVDSRLEEMTATMVKSVIKTMLQKHLGWVVVWGGVFGAILGLLHFYMVG